MLVRGNGEGAEEAADLNPVRREGRQAEVGRKTDNRAVLKVSRRPVGSPHAKVTG